MSRQLRVAAAQYSPEALVSLSAYKAKITKWVAEAVAGGGELLVFPEYGSMELAGIAAADDSLEAAIAAVTSLVPEIDLVHSTLARKLWRHHRSWKFPGKYGCGCSQCRPYFWAVRR